jgi:hypothetical protein
VKISGDAPPIDSMLLPVSMCPDLCLSFKKTKKVINNVVVVEEESDKLDKEPVVPFLLKDEETEFDAFLLDAVQWL